jgi:hypothetical protein
MRVGRVLFAFAVAAAFAAPARAELLITVDKSSQTMSVDVDGSTRYVWPVSTGAPGYDTPSGQFKPFRMEADHFSKEWDDAPMPHSIFFTMKGHAIHGSSHVKAIGTAASHGCVRLEPKNAAVLFELVKQQKMANTRVVLTGETPVARGVPVARQNNDRNYQRSTAAETYGRSYTNEDDSADYIASVPQRTARQGRVVRDQYGREYIIYDSPSRYADQEIQYEAPRRYRDEPFGWPFGR